MYDDLEGLLGEDDNEMNLKIGPEMLLVDLNRKYKVIWQPLLLSLLRSIWLHCLENLKHHPCGGSKLDLYEIVQQAIH